MSCEQRVASGEFLVSAFSFLVLSLPGKSGKCDWKLETRNEKLETRNEKQKPMLRYFAGTIAWLACVVFSTVPSFWFMVHPFAERWRARQRSPYRLLLPAWIGMWVVVAAVTWRWRTIVFYQADWLWVSAVLLFACGFYLYSQAGKNFSAKQLGGIPEVHGRSPEQILITDGIRSRVRHPVYLAHLCEMIAWSLGTGLAVCWALTGFAVVTGAVMIRMEDAELEKRFGEEYRAYRKSVPAVLPRLLNSSRI